MSEKKKEQTTAKRSVAGLLGLVLGVINLGGTGFVAFTVMSMPPASAAAKEKVSSAPPQPGPVVDLQPFIVNLDDTGPARYLKIRLSVELSSPEVLAGFTAAEHQVRDAFLTYLSSLDVNGTRGEEGKTKIRDDLVLRARQQAGEDAVKSIYFGEFVVQ